MPGRKTMSNTASLVSAYISAKAELDAAEARVKALKAQVLIASNGGDIVEGDDADIRITVGQRSSLDAKLVAQLLSPEQVAACTKRGAPYEVLNVRAKVARAA
jgi:hypothetical protein